MTNTQHAAYGKWRHGQNGGKLNALHARIAASKFLSLSGNSGRAARMRNIYGILPTCAAVAVCILVGLASQSALAARNPADWPTFGGDNTRTNANTAPTKITAANVGSMVRMQVKISQPIDAGLIYLHGVKVNNASHNVFFGTTYLGRTVAIDADTGKVLWEFVPPDFDEATAAAGAPAGGRGLIVKQITNSTPVADDNHQFIYAASPDGKVTKIAIADGKTVWSTAVTKMPVMEKLDSPLSFIDGHVLVSTAGYIGDTPPYQGHIVVLNAKSGVIEHVWNSLCANRHELMNPKSCKYTRSAIWGRAGIVRDPATGNLLFATGNGPYNGKTAWGDTLIMLNSSATRVLGNWTTTNNAELNTRDLDMGSTSPVLLGDGYIAQGGKDGTIRLVSMNLIKGRTPHQGGELQLVDVPGKAMLLSASATVKIGGTQYLFVSAGHSGTAVWKFGTDHRLKKAWSSDTGGNSPFYAGGLLYIYDAQGGNLHIFDAATGKSVATLDCGKGHWSSPIVVDNRIALPEGVVRGFSFKNRRGRRGAPGAATGGQGGIPTGIVNIWHLP